jgi:hypothetical protein
MLRTHQRVIIPCDKLRCMGVFRWSKPTDCHFIRRIRWRHNYWNGVFSLVNNGSETMKVFLPPFLFSLLCFGSCVKPLKIQPCPLVYICFKIGSFLFRFLFALILVLLEFSFLFQFHSPAFISFNFCI